MSSHDTDKSMLLDKVINLHKQLNYLCVECYNFSLCTQAFVFCYSITMFIAFLTHTSTNQTSIGLMLFVGFLLCIVSYVFFSKGHRDSTEYLASTDLLRYYDADSLYFFIEDIHHVLRAVKSCFCLGFITLVSSIFFFFSPFLQLLL